ncbi:LodA/GoxA family CTQ-dependent oxidase [Kitasatospora sp. DSM 101779]|uniref:LodA/GoxA family CTQ-dependent oxidase n=1 Tax=Kitasatospora sp. DSM 101779 TaxID=2853165 RepID=UPI0021D9D408|nr:LodA/GoxA family CTQ-dependent oxidase [Kitasatospora sp. DSM 101779]MCU7820782.1 LodA/GoxA family CTQ-dependent oxidase [Kitasatospora sp. DSM 101779]
MLDEVVRAAIHPAIGIARVGNSPEEFYLAPEVPDPLPEEPGFYKDASGAVKREVARFRVYGYNARGEVVAELTPDNADIRWTAHLANKKAAWYQFQLALDIPDAALAKPAELRNKDITGDLRRDLVIDPGAIGISGRSVSGPDFHFRRGTFMGKEVYLGELRTDEDGRLLVFGGFGASASYNGVPVHTYANNDGWHDDVADGPVTAEVTVGGRGVPVDPAWVLVGPPNYAPALKGIRTLHDLLFDVFVGTGALPFPEKVSFTRHIAPVLQRFCDHQWVNHGFAGFYGHQGLAPFVTPEAMQRLSSTSPGRRALRRQVFNALRDFGRDGGSPVPWPWLYGDGMAVPPRTPLQHMALSPTQYRMFQYWADGEFEDDWGSPDVRPVHRLADLPAAEQPAALDRAALDFCLADAFHPGCEVTWPIRHASMYMAPFRIRHRSPDRPEPSYGTVLTPETALSVNGPLYAQGPGDLSRWMAVPWQTDTASCRSGYELALSPRHDPYLPTFWPARVPNHVLTEEDYRVVVDESRPLDERTEAFERRAVWLRGLKGQNAEQLNQMIDDWYRLGIVEVRDGVAGFPDRIQVESAPSIDLTGVPHTQNLVTLHVPQAADPAAASVAINQAIAVSGYSADEVTAGFIDKVAPFRDSV